LQGAVTALQNQPVVNAVIDGDDIIYRDYVDISIAVGTPKVFMIYALIHAYIHVETNTMYCCILLFLALIGIIFMFNNILGRTM
jgi:2-oxoacid dehydrogenases acyltransferase (catalytic domain)